MSHLCHIDRLNAACRWNVGTTSHTRTSMRFIARVSSARSSLVTWLPLGACQSCCLVAASLFSSFLRYMQSRFLWMWIGPLSGYSSILQSRQRNGMMRPGAGRPEPAIACLHALRAKFSKGVGTAVVWQQDGWQQIYRTLVIAVTPLYPAGWTRTPCRRV